MMIVQRLKRRLIRLVKNPYKLYKRNIELKEIFTGYTKAVILGSADTINKLDLTKFKDEIIITVGNFYEHPQIETIRPHIHVFAASHPPITKQVLRKWWTRCNDVLPKSTLLLIEKRDMDISTEIFSDRNVYYYSYGGHLSMDFTKPIMSPWSVTIVALQLALYCDVKTIGLMGVNHDWQCRKPYMHFYDHNKPSLEYYLKQENITIGYEAQKQPFPKERLYREYELYQQYEALKKIAQSINCRIKNYDPFSDFDVFEFDRKNELILKH